MDKMVRGDDRMYGGDICEPFMVPETNSSCVKGT